MMQSYFYLQQLKFSISESITLTDRDRTEIGQFSPISLALDV